MDPFNHARAAGASMALAIACVFAGGAGPALAQEELPSGPVRLDVTICVGTEQEGPVDPSCRPMRSRLNMMRVGSLKLQREETYDISARSPASVALATGDDLEIRLVSIVMESNDVHMLVTLPDQGQTRVKVKNGRPFTIGGPKVSEGRMIIEIRPSLRDGLRPIPGQSRTVTTPGQGRPAPSPSGN